MIKNTLNRSNLAFAALLSLGLLVKATSVGAWSIEDVANDDLPGRSIEIRNEGQLVAGFIYGEGQDKPYLAVFDSEERRLTNPGMNEEGNSRGRFPHHRGIFIGWNHIDTDLGRDDLWHVRQGEQQKMVSIERKETSAESALIEVIVHWLSKDRDDELEGRLIEERRFIRISRPQESIQIDHRSELTALRDLRLGGDLQHAGLHFRADAKVDQVRDETKYLYSPADLPPGNGRIVSDDLEWVNFRFPLFDQWYSVTQFDSPANRSTELSWRDYGRFGFFFQDELERGDIRVMDSRFIIREMAESGDDTALRQTADNDFQSFLRSRE